VKNFYVLSDALKFMEDNLFEPITQEDVARASCVSLSSLQKLFRYALNYSLKEYLAKRRLTCAAKDLINTEASVTEIAMKYQYNSLETFSRAFAKLWGESPSAYREIFGFIDMFPKLNIELQNGMEFIGFHADVSELYDKLQENEGTYILCFDVVDLIPINQISRDAGDLAILETVKIITKYIDDTMLLFRIGGDEFALLSGLKSADEVEKLAEKVLAHNGSKLTYKNTEFPIVIRAWASKYENDKSQHKHLIDHFRENLKVMKKTNEDLLIEL
jgi:AraC family transcriptional regulator